MLAQNYYSALNTIEIQTAQKVVIQYELASVGNRMSAFTIDMAILIGVLIFLMTILSQVILASGDEVFLYFFLLVMAPIFLFYTLVSEILLDGQTLGKRLVGLKVVKLNGDPAEPFDYLLRWSFRFVDIWFSAGAVAALLISSSQNNQRLGGMLSGTAVIRKSSTRNFALKDILNISIQDYEPIYPQVTQLSEQDMLFVKKVLERARRYRNEAHRKALAELADKMSEQLSVKILPTEREKFLKTALTDYIVLTR